MSKASEKSNQSLAFHESLDLKEEISAIEKARSKWVNHYPANADLVGKCEANFHDLYLLERAVDRLNDRLCLEGASHVEIVNTAATVIKNQEDMAHKSIMKESKLEKEIRDLKAKIVLLEKKPIDNKKKWNEKKIEREFPEMFIPPDESEGGV